MAEVTRVMVNREAAGDLRAARRDLAAREGADLTLSDVLRRAVAALRQLTGMEAADRGNHG